MDPRNYQIAALSAFVVIGVSKLGFQIDLLNAVVIVSVALFTQLCLFSHSPEKNGPKRKRPERKRPEKTGQAKSALISSLSLVLLLRTDVLAIAGIAAVMAIASKRYLRLGADHLFNPSAFALVVVTGISSQAYLSPGQWGALGLTAFLVMGIGLLVVTRAQRLDVALSFLLTFAALVFLRGWYLGDPAAIALHQMQSGALLLFAFFMITDPKTTPTNRSARIGFGIAVACTAAILQFNFYLSAASIYALVLLAPVVPFLNLYTRKNTNVEENTRDYRAVNVVQYAKRDGLLRILRRQS